MVHQARAGGSRRPGSRRADLGATMSSYLVTEISKTDNVRVRLATEVTGGHGQCSLETLTLRDRASGAADTVPAAALFVMIGAEPRTAWLPDSVGRDEEGFILTGRNLQRAGKLPADWPFERPPLLLETSIPGVFAAGDVRHRSIKRLASAVGEGATAIQLVHEYLRAEQD
jgi:thioredoxin reductase (NADPH)